MLKNIIECTQHNAEEQVTDNKNNVFYSLKKRLRYCMILTQFVVLLLLNMLRNQNNKIVHFILFTLLFNLHLPTLNFVKFLVSECVKSNEFNCISINNLTIISSLVLNCF